MVRFGSSERGTELMLLIPPRNPLRAVKVDRAKEGHRNAHRVEQCIITSENVLRWRELWTKTIPQYAGGPPLPLYPPRPLGAPR